VTADVVERAEEPAGVARDDDAFATHIAQEILARLANLLGSSSADPASEEESLHFLLKQFRICVVPGGQSFRGRVHHQNYGTGASTLVLAEPDQLHPALGRQVPVLGADSVAPGPGQVSGVWVRHWFEARLLRSSFCAILPVPPFQQLGIVLGFRREVNGTAEGIKNAAVNVLTHLPAELGIK
jgi:hypothetical protein